MTNAPKPAAIQHDSGRYKLAGALVLLFAVAGLVLRIVLYAAFHQGDAAAGTLAACLALGSVRDLLTAPLALLPVLLALATLRLAWLARPWPRFLLLCAVSGLLVFEALVEYFFFEEFDARRSVTCDDRVMRHARSCVALIRPLRYLAVHDLRARRFIPVTVLRLDSMVGNRAVRR